MTERDEARKRAKKRWEWETARDEEIQQNMEFKERAEDYCCARIIETDGKDVLQLTKGDQFFHALTFTAYYEQAIAKLKAHIPHLDHDPRIVSELVVEFPLG